jgi:hypothetical protein
VGAQTLPHDGRPPRSRETKPTTFETLTLCPLKGGVCGRLFCDPHRLAIYDGRAGGFLATLPKTGSLPQSGLDSLSRVFSKRRALK